MSAWTDVRPLIETVHRATSETPQLRIAAGVGSEAAPTCEETRTPSASRKEEGKSRASLFLSEGELPYESALVFSELDETSIDLESKYGVQSKPEAETVEKTERSNRRGNCGVNHAKLSDTVQNERLPSPSHRRT